MGINYEPELDKRISSKNSILPTKYWEDVFLESSGVPTWYKSAGALARRGNLGKLCEPVMQTAHTWIPWEKSSEGGDNTLKKLGFVPKPLSKLVLANHFFITSKKTFVPVKSA